MRCAADMARIIEMDETAPPQTPSESGQQLARALLVERQMEALSKWNRQVQVLPAANREAYEAAIHLIAEQVLATQGHATVAPRPDVSP